jgi:holo-[acyl-carrier-protein] synthase
MSDTTDANGDPARRLAERFAVKEAVMKALGRFFDEGVYLRDIEVFFPEEKKAVVKLSPTVEQRLERCRTLVSYSETERHVVATAFITGEE